MTAETVAFVELVRAAQAAADSARADRSFVGRCENCGVQARQELMARAGRQQVYKCWECGYTRFYTVTP